MFLLLISFGQEEARLAARLLQRHLRMAIRLSGTGRGCVGGDFVPSPFSCNRQHSRYPGLAAVLLRTTVLGIPQFSIASAVSVKSSVRRAAALRDRIFLLPSTCKRTKGDFDRRHHTSSPSPHELDRTVPTFSSIPSAYYTVQSRRRVISHPVSTLRVHESGSSQKSSNTGLFT